MLYILQHADSSAPAPPNAFDPSGWELALVTTPGTDISSANNRQLVGPLYISLFAFY